MELKVKRLKKKSSNAFSVIFDKIDTRFYPGQYIEFDDKCFTIASSPSEDFLMITTRPGISDFKKKLENIKVGEILETSHPAGTFTIDEVDPAVFLAGGIGITPFRSMIKWVVDRKLKTPITLIYSNSDENFIFKDELDSWQSELPNLTIHYINTGKDGRLDKEKLEQLVSSTYHLVPTSVARQRQASLIYYLAGPPAMVDNFEAILLNMGVDKTNIRTDRFDGY